MLVKLIALSLLALQALGLNELTIPDGVSISATRSVDLTSQIVKTKLEYEIKNQGKTDINHFIHTIPQKEDDQLAWLSAYEKGKKEAAKLRTAKVAVKGAPEDMATYKIELLNLVAAGASITVIVEYSVTKYLVAYPEEITQAENQFVVYKGFANVLSGYPVDKETSNFKVGSTKPISFTEHSPSKFATDRVSYGPYEKQKPYTQKAISIHYENNSPFLVATSVERVIEISHWGNIAVEDHIEVVHKGAKMKTLLPAHSHDVYYRDHIGNISTSALYSKSDRLEVDLRPRFPLFGGWRTNYVLGYNIPTSGFLYSSGYEFALKMRLLDHLFENAVVEKLKVKIILPEKSKNIKLVTPYPVKRFADEVHKTYLDVEGRPVIVFEKKNLVDNHIQKFTLYYEFDRSYLVREPLIAFSAFFTLFIALIIFLRLDFSIGNMDTKDHTKKE